jgi:hypothetical protein
MQGPKRQTGITLIGFIFLLGIAGIFIYVGMKLIPVYSEYYSVLRAMKQVQAEPGGSGRSPDEIRGSLMNKLYISYANSVNNNNVKIVRSGGGYLLTVQYEVRGNLIHNIDFVASFNKTVDLSRPGVD